MIEEIFFILHVVDGIHIIIHNVVRKKYTYMYSNTNNNIIILILVRISLNLGLIIQILFCQVLENGNRYKIEIFSLNLFFKRLSNDISQFAVAENFVISA